MTLPVALNTITAAQINVELNRSSSATFSMNGTAERALAGITGSGTTISFGNFHGKSSYLDQQTVTVGFAQTSTYTTGGYGAFSTSFIGNAPNVGAISDGTFNPISNKPIAALFWDANTSQVRFELLTLASPVPNSGWTNMNISGYNYTRSSATYTAGTNANNGKTVWRWSRSNPFGTTTNVQKVVTFT